MYIHKAHIFHAQNGVNIVYEDKTKGWFVSNGLHRTPRYSTRCGTVLVNNQQTTKLSSKLVHLDSLTDRNIVATKMSLCVSRTVTITDPLFRSPLFKCLKRNTVCLCIRAIVWLLIHCGLLTVYGNLDLRQNRPLTVSTPRGRLNKKDGLTRYGNSHVKDKTS